MDYSKLAVYKDEYSDSGWSMHVFSYFDITINCLLFFQWPDFPFCVVHGGNHGSCFHQHKYPVHTS